MLGKIDAKTEARRRRQRLRKRKQNKSQIDSEASIYDIPKENEMSKYWRRWSDCKKEIGLAFKKWQAKQKKKNAHANFRNYKQWQNVFSETACKGI